MTEHIAATDVRQAIGNTLSVDGPLAGFGIHYDFKDNGVAEGPEQASATATLNMASVARAEQAIGLKPQGPTAKATPGRDINAKPDAQNAAMFTKAGVAPTPRASGRRVLNYSVHFKQQNLQLRKGPQARQAQRQLLTLRRHVDQIQAQSQKQVAFKPTPAKMPRSMLKQVIAADIAKGAHMTVLGPVVAAAKEVGLVLEKDDKLNLKPAKLQYKLDAGPKPKRNKLLTLGL